MRLIQLGCALALATAGAAHADGPPFAGAPKSEKADAPKPATRAWTVVQKGDKSFSFEFRMSPGVPDPNQLTEVYVIVNEQAARAHPRYGNTIPQESAQVVLELENAAGQVVGRYKAHGIPLSSGKYGVHMTPGTEGLHTIRLSGKTAEGVALSGELKLPVGVWPLPKELEGAGEAPGTGGRRAVPVKL